MTTETFTRFLDLYGLFVLDIFGVDNTHVFIFAAFFLIAFMAAQFRFPNIITLATFGLFALVLASAGGFESVLAITLFIIGGIFSFALGKLIGNK